MDGRLENMQKMIIVALCHAPVITSLFINDIHTD